VAEDDGLPRAPVLVKNRGAIFSRDCVRTHGMNFSFIKISNSSIYAHSWVYLFSSFGIWLLACPCSLPSILSAMDGNRRTKKSMMRQSQV
jgi:hypothetical protein